MVLNSAFGCRLQRNYVTSVSSLFHTSGNTVYLPGSLSDDKYSLSCNDETRVNFLVLSIISGLKSVVIVPKQIYLEDSEPFGLETILASFKGYFCYGAVDFIVISERKLTSNELHLGTGDRLTFIPQLKKLDLLGRKLNASAYLRSKQELVSRGTS